MPKAEIQTCFSPALFPYFNSEDTIVIVVDILRASSAICTAIHHGVGKMIPVAGIEEAKAYQRMGYLTACERNAVKLEGFDFGNSPFSFMDESLKGKTIVISTTNGTQAIHAAKDSFAVVIGSFLNLETLAQWLRGQNKNIIILCAGWKNRFNLEDTLFAGSLADELLKSQIFSTNCDSTISSIHLYKLAQNNLMGFLENSSHRHRLKDLDLEKDIRYCLTLNTLNTIPVYKEGGLIRMDS